MPSGRAMSRRIAVLRAARVAAAFDPDARGLDALWAEDEALVHAFRSAAWDAIPVVWNAPSIAWDEFAAAIVRSTWDYIDDLDGFLASLASIAATTPRSPGTRASATYSTSPRAASQRLVAATLTRLSA